MCGRSPGRLIHLWLRRSQGINTVEFKNRFGEDIFDLFREPLGKYIKLGFLVHSGELVTLPDSEHVVGRALETGSIQDSDVELLHRWRKDPAHYQV